MRELLRVLKGAYDVAASYLLAWVLLFAIVALVFQLVLGLFVVLLAGFETTESFWIWVDRTLPSRPSLALRLVVFGLLHAGLLLLCRRHLAQLKAGLERAADRALRRYRRWAKRHRRGRAVAGGLFSVAVTLLLVPFVIQPTLVPLRLGGRAWARRAANLVDGSASAALLDSVVGLYRKVYARPVIFRGVDEAAFAARRGELMDRWDPLIREVVEADPEAFARLKAVMWVESGGEQWAVSRTGCVGLMQFCSRTARSGAFHGIFGVGQVYQCRCDGDCRVPRDARLDLESGNERRIRRQKDAFPCELTDGRFDPKKSLAAGWLFLRELSRELDGNLALTYIAYNSGPTVARRLFGTLGRRGDADLATIARHLPAALRPHYGDAADARASGLSRVHLPKLLRAYQGYGGSRSWSPRPSPATGRGRVRRGPVPDGLRAARPARGARGSSRRGRGPGAGRRR
jgi:soluble lytic murein transglycosylase-like protein